MEILLLEHKSIKKDLEERNLEILRLWDEEEKNPDEISKIFNLTEVRIYQILKEYHRLINVDKEWEKKKRIHKIKGWIKKNPDTKKDAFDLLQQLKVEFEGEGKHPDILINKVEVVIEYGTAYIQNQEKRNDRQGNFIDIETSSMLRK